MRQCQGPPGIDQVRVGEGAADAGEVPAAVEVIQLRPAVAVPEPTRGDVE
jgi:hypothetical protein